MENKKLICLLPFDYLRWGELYDVTIKSQYWHFECPETGAGTFIPAWQCKEAMQSGRLVEA